VHRATRARPATQMRAQRRDARMTTVSESTEMACGCSPAARSRTRGKGGGDGLPLPERRRRLAGVRPIRASARSALCLGCSVVERRETEQQQQQQQLACFYRQNDTHNTA
jgi:hypothetical protein